MEANSLIRNIRLKRFQNAKKQMNDISGDFNRVSPYDPILPHIYSTKKPSRNVNHQKINSTMINLPKTHISTARAFNEVTIPSENDENRKKANTISKEGVASCRKNSEEDNMMFVLDAYTTPLTLPDLELKLKEMDKEYAIDMDILKLDHSKFIKITEMTAQHTDVIHNNIPLIQTNCDSMGAAVKSISKYTNSMFDMHCEKRENMSKRFHNELGCMQKKFESLEHSHHTFVTDLVQNYQAQLDTQKSYYCNQLHQSQLKYESMESNYQNQIAEIRGMSAHELADLREKLELELRTNRASAQIELNKVQAAANLQLQEVEGLFNAKNETLQHNFKEEYHNLKTVSSHILASTINSMTNENSNMKLRLEREMREQMERHQMDRDEMLTISNEKILKLIIASEANLLRAELERQQDIVALNKELVRIKLESSIILAMKKLKHKEKRQSIQDHLEAKLTENKQQSKDDMTKLSGVYEKKMSDLSSTHEYRVADLLRKTQAEVTYLEASHAAELLAAEKINKKEKDTLISSYEQEYDSLKCNYLLALENANKFWSMRINKLQIQQAIDLFDAKRKLRNIEDKLTEVKTERDRVSEEFQSIQSQLSNSAKGQIQMAERSRELQTCNEMLFVEREQQIYQLYMRLKTTDKQPHALSQQLLAAQNEIREKSNKILEHISALKCIEDDIEKLRSKILEIMERPESPEGPSQLSSKLSEKEFEVEKLILKAENLQFEIKRLHLGMRIRSNQFEEDIVVKKEKRKEMRYMDDKRRQQAQSSEELILRLEHTLTAAKNHMEETNRQSEILELELKHLKQEIYIRNEFICAKNRELSALSNDILHCQAVNRQLYEQAEEVKMAKQCMQEIIENIAMRVEDFEGINICSDNRNRESNGRPELLALELNDSQQEADTRNESICDTDLNMQLEEQTLESSMVNQRLQEMVEDLAIHIEYMHDMEYNSNDKSV